MQQLDAGINTSLEHIASRDDIKKHRMETSPPRQVDKGLQNTYREDLTSMSAGSKQAFFGQD